MLCAGGGAGIALRRPFSSVGRTSQVCGGGLPRPKCLLSMPAIPFLLLLRVREELLLLRVREEATVPPRPPPRDIIPRRGTEFPACKGGTFIVCSSEIPSVSEALPALLMFSGQSSLCNSYKRQWCVTVAECQKVRVREVNHRRGFKHSGALSFETGLSHTTVWCLIFQQ